MSNPSNELPLINTKNLWCRDARVAEIKKILGRNPFKEARGCHVRECKNGSACRGAHKKDEILALPHIEKWERLDKSLYNFPEVYFEIYNVIKTQKTDIKDATLKKKVDDLDSLTFIEIVQSWRELSCYHRRIVKEAKDNNQLPWKSQWRSSQEPRTHSSGYIFADEVPRFILNEKTEDHMWAFERMTRDCEKHKTFIENLNKRIDITIWDICLGDINCKEGVHHIDEKICADDFQNGTCSCLSKDDFNQQMKELNESIQDLKQKLKDETKEKSIEKIKVNLSNKMIKLNGFQRKIHYSDVGMKPFAKQLEEFKEVKKVEEEKRVAIEDSKPKPAWEHSLENVKGKVVKISLRKK